MALEYFKSKLQDFARPNMYKVKITPDSSLGYFGDLDITTELVKAINIPEESLGEITYNFRGQKIVLPGDKNFGQLTLTLYDDIDLVSRSFFYEWHNSLYDYSRNVYLPRKSLNSKISIIQLNRAYKEMNTHTYYKIFPTSVSDLQFQNDTDNSLLEYTVNFAYSYSDYTYA